MGVVAHQTDRDRAIYEAWVNGARQVDLAERYGIDQSNISRAIARYQATLPAVEKEAEIRRTLALVDDLLAVYVPPAIEGKTAANREVRGLLALRGKYLGVDRREVHVEHGGTVTHTYQPPPESAAQLMERWRDEGLIRAELTRQDGGP